MRSPTSPALVQAIAVRLGMTQRAVCRLFSQGRAPLLLGDQAHRADDDMTTKPADAAQ
jgi:hypothetical protein